MHILNPFILGGYDIPVANLKHYYKLNANANDSVGVSNGTATDVTYTSGHTGDAATFNGSTSRISLPNNLWTNPAEIAVTGFFKADNTSSEYRVVALNDNTGSPYVLIRLNNTTAGRIGMIVNNDTSLNEVTTDSYTVTDWVHIGIGADENGSADLYVNGVYVGQDATFGNFTQVTTNGNYFGAGRNGSTARFDGQMFGVGIWDVKPTAQQFSDIFDKQDSGQHLV